jgi:hypothetical protein
MVVAYQYLFQESSLDQLDDLSCLLGDRILGVANAVELDITTEPRYQSVIVIGLFILTIIQMSLMPDDYLAW